MAAEDRNCVSCVCTSSTAAWRPSAMAAGDRNDYELSVDQIDAAGGGRRSYCGPRSKWRCCRPGIASTRWRPPQTAAGDRNFAKIWICPTAGVIAAAIDGGRGSQLN